MLSLFNINTDILSIIIDKLYKKRYNIVINHFIHEWKKRAPLINTYISGRQTHEGRQFLKSHNVGPLIDYVYKYKYYIYGILLDKLTKNTNRYTDPPLIGLQINYKLLIKQIRCICSEKNINLSHKRGVSHSDAEKPGSFLIRFLIEEEEILIKEKVNYNIITYDKLLDLKKIIDTLPIKNRYELYFDILYIWDMYYSKYEFNAKEIYMKYMDLRK